MGLLSIFTWRYSLIFFIDFKKVPGIMVTDHFRNFGYTESGIAEQMIRVGQLAFSAVFHKVFLKLPFEKSTEIAGC